MAACWVVSLVRCRISWRCLFLCAVMVYCWVSWSRRRWGAPRVIALVACFMMMVIILAVLAMIVVKALTIARGGAGTVAFTIPLALFMGIDLAIRVGRIGEVSVIGLVFGFCHHLGGWVAESSTWALYFDFTGVQLT
ncbi:carbon starvation CstA family protein [Escherichia coli]